MCMRVFRVDRIRVYLYAAQRGGMCMCVRACVCECTCARGTTVIRGRNLNFFGGEKSGLHSHVNTIIREDRDALSRSNQNQYGVATACREYCKGVRRKKKSQGHTIRINIIILSNIILRCSYRKTLWAHIYI